MKTAHALLALALCALVLPLSSCLGTKTDDAALFAPAALAWPAVEADYLRGLADGTEDGDLTEEAAQSLQAQGAAMEQALATKDREALRLVPWLAMRPWAQRGIDDKLGDAEIGPGVAASLVEQLANFTLTINRLQAP